ncbi:MAG: lysophospholipid acyltransferase family protein [Desulfobacterales bacterium]|uniref:Lysophospholipid acyltransferase family protein n=1 Tax=Candidatus Desulfatibia vada TaxID=2841696 RepID=A0A8J6P2W0_9BACT|nr:lysophospholipid acyltransferase family protein [Candidatus Desulfatibia vada]MBL6971139.1 lysophospholipid acyltransferase family protein [Desulfobacterales bacterium]
MNYTIFDTPVLNILLRWFSLIALRIAGWRTHGRLPATPKFVLVGAPHTSNWDLPCALFIILVLRGKICWLGKESLFRRPHRGFFKWLGGIPIDRSKSKNVVAQSIQQFNQNKTMILTIAPEGTRSRVKKWKTGFYHIAKGANVPIALGFLDYRRKLGGIGPFIYPTGNIEADMKTIRAFYDGITGKFPEKSMI